MKYKILTGIIFASLSLLAGPKVTKAASIYLSPNNGIYEVGQTITINVYVNTDGATVNTAETDILYKPEYLELKDVQQGSTFFLATPGSPQKNNGSAYLGGGLPNPGYKGGQGQLGVLTFVVKAVGQTEVTAANAKALLNDGQGTTVDAKVFGTKLKINPPEVQGVQVTSSPKVEAVIDTSIATGSNLLQALTKSISVPIYLLLLFILSFLVVMAILWELMLRKNYRENDFNLSKIQAEIDQSLENLKDEISHKFTSLPKTDSQELIRAESLATVDLQSDVIETKGKIDQKITKSKRKPRAKK